MNRTAQRAGQLYGVLDALRTGTPTPVDLGVSVATLTGLPARDVADRVANALHPPDGTQDAEAGRDAMARALADVQNAAPAADLTSPTPEQIGVIIERYVAYDLCNRIELDIGQAVLDKAPSYAEGMRRLEQIERYVREKVSAQFRSREDQGQRLTRQSAEGLSRGVIEDTFEVFEEYV